MWEKIGATSTGEIFANGAYYLASMWAGAWNAGKGNTNVDDLDTINIDDMVAVYEDQNFLPSVNIKEIGSVIGL